MIAALKGHSSIVKVLLEAGAEKDAKDKVRFARADRRVRMVVEKAAIPLRSFVF